MSFAFGAVDRGAHADVRRRLERERLPALVLVPAPDHDLHDGDPRRRRQPGRGRPRRGPDRRPARGAPRPGRLARPLLRRHRRSASSRRSGSRGGSPPCSAGSLVVRVRRPRRSPGAIDDAWVNGSGGDGRRRGRLHGATGSSCRRRPPTGSRPSRTSRSIALALLLTLLQGLGAARRARAGALPRRIRVGERHAREAGADAVHHPRRPPDRAHDRCARPGCSARSAWRSSRWREKLLDLQGVSMSFGGLQGDRPASTCTSTRARSSA